MKYLPDQSLNIRQIENIEIKPILQVNEILMKINH